MSDEEETKQVTLRVPVSKHHKMRTMLLERHSSIQEYLMGAVDQLVDPKESEKEGNQP
jgi:hypothetical protein